MKQFTSKNQQVGEVGEKIATNFLQSRGFVIVERNYTKKIGEVDIVAQKDNILHFVEVKALHVDLEKEGVQMSPFENITPFKFRKLVRTIQWYLVERRVSLETKWVIDAIAVLVTREARHAKVEVLWNIVA